MTLQQVLGAALLVAASFDPIDRAHGAKPSTSAMNEATQREPGFWQRIRGRLFSQKSKDKPAQSTSRSGRLESTARSSAKPDGEETIVHSNVSLSTLLGRRLNGKQESKNPMSKKSEDVALAQQDRRPILDRLRSGLSWNRERPAETVSEHRFAGFTKPKVESQVDSDPKLPDLQPVPATVAIASSTSASDSAIPKNYPVGENKLLTRIDSNPRWTTPPSLVPALQGNLTDKTTGTLTALAPRDAMMLVTPESVAVETEANKNVVADRGNASIESPTQIARPNPPVSLTVLDHESEASGLADPKELEQAGPALIDPNNARSAVESIPAAPGDEAILIMAAPEQSPLPVTAAVQREPAATHESPATVEPAKLEFGDPTAPAPIAQTGFVHHSTSVVTSNGSNTRHNLNGVPARRDSGTPHQSILSGILAPALCERLDHLPIECYPIGGLLLASMLVLLHLRGRRTTVDDAVPSLANVAAHPSGTFDWPLSMVLPSASYARGIGQTAQPRGSLVGPLTTTIGLAITAVGAMAVLRAQVAQLPALMRPGVMIAAIGQFVLLLGIVTLTVHRRRLANARKSAAFGLAQAESVVVQPIVAGTIPYMALGSNYAWPSATSANGGQNNPSGQIAQLKAQLACLSQQLDHLGIRETSGPAKSE